MDTGTAARTQSDETPTGGRWRVLGVGALAGVVAGLALTLAQALARWWLG